MSDAPGVVEMQDLGASRRFTPDPIEVDPHQQ